jgi:hypothetical protein
VVNADAPVDAVIADSARVGASARLVSVLMCARWRDGRVVGSVGARQTQNTPGAVRLLRSQLAERGERLGLR